MSGRKSGGEIEGMDIGDETDKVDKPATLFIAAS
jgi:hypothetical protein